MKKSRMVSLLLILSIFILSSVLLVTNATEVQAANVSISKKTATIAIGQKLSLTVKNAEKAVKWSSSNSKIAKVTSKGVVTGVKKGKATITARVGKTKYTCKVMVKTPSLSKKSVTIAKGEALTLTLNNNVKTVKWSSNNSKVAKVTSKGVVTGVKKGTATITATVDSVKYTCRVTIETPSLNKTSAAIYIGKSTTLKLNNTSRNVTWSTSDKTIATINKNGKVTGKKKGTVKITAKVGSKKYIATVKVNTVLTVSSTKVTLKDTLNITVGLRVNGRLSYRVADSDIIECNWGKWNDGNVELAITGLKNGSTTITITNDYNKEEITVKVNVEGIEVPTGEVYGNITYYYNHYWGNRADTGATVILIPKDGQAKDLVVDSYVYWTMITANFEEYGVYKAKVDGVGQYQIQNVPEGEYYAFIISSETTSGVAFSDKEGYEQEIKDMMSGVLSEDAAGKLAEIVGYKKYVLKSVTVYGDKSTLNSYDFGITYI